MSTKRRLFVPNDALIVGLSTLSAEETHYATKVLRLAYGTQVEVFDGTGQLGQATLTEPKKAARHPQAGLVIETITDATRKRRLIVGCARPKGERADWLVEKLAELGCERLDWLTFADSQNPRPQASSAARHERLALSALRQSGQAFTMGISEPESLLAWLLKSSALDSLKWVAHPHDARPLKARPAGSETGSVCHLLIGPEAGFRSCELREAQAAGYTPFTVSDHILRIETAAIASAACLLA